MSMQVLLPTHRMSVPSFSRLTSNMCDSKRNGVYSFVSLRLTGVSTLLFVIRFMEKGKKKGGGREKRL